MKASDVKINYFYEVLGIFFILIISSYAICDLFNLPVRTVIDYSIGVIVAYSFCRIMNRLDNLK